MRFREEMVTFDHLLLNLQARFELVAVTAVECRAVISNVNHKKNVLKKDNCHKNKESHFI